MVMHYKHRNAVMIREIREKSGKSQSDIAKILDVSQSQYCRYESDPGKLSLEMATRIAAILGCGISDLFQTPQIHKNTRVYCDLERANEIQKRLDIVASYINGLHNKGYSSQDLFALRELVKRSRRNPTVACIGNYDAGKSHLINSLLGIDILPTGYQPKTRIPLLLQHQTRKPEWLSGHVLLLRKGIDFSKFDDDNHCREFHLANGGYEILQTSVVHSADDDEYQNAALAMVYVDSPVLIACNILDLPGFQHIDQDTEVARFAFSLADACVFISTATGFMTAYDITTFGSCISALPCHEIWGLPPLSNFLLVASHAHPGISNQQIEDIQSIGAKRVFSELQDSAFRMLEARTETQVTPQMLLDRTQAFWDETENRRTPMVRSFYKMATEDLSQMRILAINNEISELRKSEVARLTDEIDRLVSIINDRTRVSEELQEAVQEEPNRYAKALAQREKIRTTFFNVEGTVSRKFREYYDRTLTESNLIAFINQNYRDKKDAKEYAANRILQNAITEQEILIKNESARIADEVNRYIRSFQTDTGNQRFSMGFDAVPAFIGGMAGLGFVGVMGFWFSTLGSLGGYIAVAKLAGILSSLGIPLTSGGAAAFVSGVATFGGPIAIVLGIGLAITISIYLLLTSSWQKQLAKEIIKEFENKRICSSIINNISEAFNKGLAAFEQAFWKTEADYKSHMEKMKELIEETDFETLQKQIDELKKQRTALEEIPWVTLPEKWTAKHLLQ